MVPPSVDLKRPLPGPLKAPFSQGAWPRLPEHGVHDVGVRGIEGDVDAAGVLVLVEHLLEGLAAVGGAEEAALRVGAVRMAQHRDEQAVRVARIDDDLRNLLAVAQAQVRPGLAGVGGLVDAVAGGEVGALQPLAAADVDDVRDSRAPRAMAPIEPVGWSSKIGFQARP